MIKAYEPGKSVEERLILAVDLMNQSMEEVIKRLRWLSRDLLLKYVNIPREYAKIPTPTPPGGEDYHKQEASREGYQFKTLYVSAQEVGKPSSAILVRELFGKDLKDCFPRAVFVKVNGRWYRVQISYGERWRGLKLAWSSVTSVVVRFLLDKGIRDFPEASKYLSRVPHVPISIGTPLPGLGACTCISQKTERKPWKFCAKLKRALEQKLPSKYGGQSAMLSHEIRASMSL